MNAKKLTILALSLLFTACTSKPIENKKLSHNINNFNKLEVINFNFDSTTITTHETHHINEILAALNKAPKNFVILIKGHTDKIGSSRYNYQLGLLRAQSVKQALVLKGIDSHKIRVTSDGEQSPLILTTIPEERFKNRRATIEIVPANTKYTHTTISI